MEGKEIGFWRRDRKRKKEKEKMGNVEGEGRGSKNKVVTEPELTHTKNIIFYIKTLPF